MPGVVIVGGGQAGVQCADALRADGFAGPITLVAEEIGSPYQRPQLSKEFLSAAASPDTLAIRTSAYLAEREIKVLHGVGAAALDVASRTITLDDGSDVAYEHLVLATGSRNRSLPIPGVDLAGVHSLRTLDDALQLRDELASARSIVVIGAGFIGLEVASAARQYGAHVTVLDVLDRPMARVLSPTMSRYFAEAHAKDGVNLRLGEGVTSLESSPPDPNRVGAVISSSGERIQADLVIVGIGAVAETRLADQAGILTDNGIAVDAFLQTSAEHVWAIGDCARFPFDGVPHRLESVQNATDQGKYVAQRIMGHDEPYAAVPWFWSHQCGLKLQIAGVIVDPDEVVIRGDLAGGKFSAFCFRDQRLIGVESVNRVADHMTARRLLLNSVPLTPGQAADAAFDVKAASQGN